MFIKFPKLTNLPEVDEYMIVPQSMLSQHFEHVDFLRSAVYHGFRIVNVMTMKRHFIL